MKVLKVKKTFLFILVLDLEFFVGNDFLLKSS